MGKRQVIAMNDSDTILKVQASEAVVIWLKWHTAFSSWLRDICLLFELTAGRESSAQSMVVSDRWHLLNELRAVHLKRIRQKTMVMSTWGLHIAPNWF